MLPRRTVSTFNKSLILCGIVYLCLSSSVQLLHYLMTSLPDYNMSQSNVFTLAYIAHIYPMKGFLKIICFKKFE